MALPCAPPIPTLPGVPAPPQAQGPPPPPPPVPVQVGELLYPIARGALPPAQNVAPAEAPRFASDFSLSSVYSLCWLATLARATYAPTATLFQQAVAIVSTAYPVTFVANAAASSTPGYGLITLPQGAILVVSGTTNAQQWLAQVFQSQPVPIDKVDVPFGPRRRFYTMLPWWTSAAAIAPALAAIPLQNRVLYVGHSMGGAIASILAAVLSSADNSRAPGRLCTFASPKPGDVNLTAMTRTSQQTYRRMWLSGDVVPMLPPDLSAVQVIVPGPLQQYVSGWASFQHAGTGWTFNSDDFPEEQDDQSVVALLVQTFAAMIAGQPLALADAHAMVSYTARLLSRISKGVAPAPTNWANVPGLVTVNQALTAAGL
jgi:pimeloyl-ACP methyl ester carboxylesterase